MAGDGRDKRPENPGDAVGKRVERPISMDERQVIGGSGSRGGSGVPHTQC